MPSLEYIFPYSFVFYWLNQVTPIKQSLHKRGGHELIWGGQADAINLPSLWGTTVLTIYQQPPIAHGKAENALYLVTYSYRTLSELQGG